MVLIVVFFCRLLARSVERLADLDPDALFSKSFTTSINFDVADDNDEEEEEEQTLSTETVQTEIAMPSQINNSTAASLARETFRQLLESKMTQTEKSSNHAEKPRERQRIQKQISLYESGDYGRGRRDRDGRRTMTLTVRHGPPVRSLRYISIDYSFEENPNDFSHIRCRSISFPFCSASRMRWIGDRSASNNGMYRTGYAIVDSHSTNGLPTVASATGHTMQTAPQSSANRNLRTNASSCSNLVTLQQQQQQQSLTSISTLPGALRIRESYIEPPQTPTRRTTATPLQKPTFPQT